MNYGVFEIQETMSKTLKLCQIFRLNTDFDLIFKRFTMKMTCVCNQILWINFKVHTNYFDQNLKIQELPADDIGVS